MRPILLVIVLFVTSFIGYGQDNFSFDTQEYSFDSLYEGEVVNAVFLLRNTGKEPIVIKNINSGLGVTSLFSSEPIFAGKCSMITTTYDSRNHKGIISHTLKVKIGQGEKDTLVELSLIGDLVKDKRPTTKLLFTKSQFDLGKIKSGESIYYAIEFKNVGKYGAKVDDVNLINLTLLQATGLPHFCSDSGARPMVGSNEIIGVADTGTILLKTPADLKSGIYKGMIELMGNFKKQQLRILLEVQ